MGRKLLVLGESSQGKSTAGRTLNPESTFWINVTGKDLPFKAWKKLYQPYDAKTGKGNYLHSRDWEQIANAIKHINGRMPHIKVIVVDDAQYIMSFEFMERSMEKGFDKFTEIQTHFFDVITAPDSTRDDLITIFLSHTEDVSSSNGTRTKMKTIGKMLDEKITLEGLFSVVLLAYAYKKQDKTIEYVFVTQTNGSTPAKSPMGMFKDITIPNDLNYVLTEMDKYYKGE
jgi:hypothetical protein